MHPLTKLLKKAGVILGVALLAFSTVTFAQQDSLTHYYGKAYDLKSNDLLYVDEYKEYITDNGSLAAQVTYRYPNGDIIATKNVVYKHQLSSPGFEFHNQITGVLASVSANTSNITISYRPSFNDEFKMKTIDSEDNLVIDAGFHYFIQQHWTPLIQGITVPINYVSPSKQSIVALQAKKIGTELWENKETVLFSLEVRSPILRIFVDNIVVRYDIRSKRLLTYKGLSNIKLSSVPSRVYMTIHHQDKDLHPNQPEIR